MCGLIRGLMPRHRFLELIVKFLIRVAWKLKLSFKSLVIVTKSFNNLNT